MSRAEWEEVTSSSTEVMETCGCTDVAHLMHLYASPDLYLQVMDQKQSDTAYGITWCCGCSAQTIQESQAAMSPDIFY